MRVLIPGPLRSYTAQCPEVQAEGATLAEILEDLDRHFPGIRFRIIDEQDAIRPHVRIWVNKDQTRTVDTPVHTSDEVIIHQALSGG